MYAARPPSPSLRLRGLLPAVAAAGIAVILVPAALGAQEAPAPPQNVLAGARVFGEKGCGQCHAINGLGGTVGPDLAQTTTPRSVNGFAAAMWNHLPGMSAQMRSMDVEPPRFRTRETGDLIAFLFWTNYFNPTGDPDVGRELFGEKGCITCHQVEGIGGVIGPALDFSGQHNSPIHIAAALWNHGPTMSDVMRTRGTSRPTFLATELNDLLAYLGTARSDLPAGPIYVLPGRAEAGERLFETKNCSACHSIRGRGGSIAPDLATRPRRDLLEFAATLWNKAPAMTRAMRTHGIDVPELAPEDMADLVAYLASVQYLGQPGSASRGRTLLRQKGCLACHDLDGSGGGGPDLGRTTRLTSQPAVVATLWNHLSLPNVADRSGWPSLSEQEVADLVTYFASRGGSR